MGWSIAGCPLALRSNSKQSGESYVVSLEEEKEGYGVFVDNL